MTGMVSRACLRPVVRSAVDDDGQMAVEMAIALPVLFLAMVIAFDCMVYMGECARFDHAVPQVLMACASAPDEAGYGLDARVAAVQTELANQFRSHGARVSVACAGTGRRGTVRFDCKLAMAPWPFGSSAFGAEGPPLLAHSYSFAIDLYTPGEFL